MGLLLWTSSLEGWGLSPAVLSVQEHSSFQNGFASIKYALTRGLFSTGRREATEGFQMPERSWTSLSKEHQEHGGKFSMHFSKFLSPNTVLEKETATQATHSSIIAWRIPWTGEPGGLWRFVGLQRVRGLSTQHTVLHSVEQQVSRIYSSCLTEALPASNSSSPYLYPSWCLATTTDSLLLWVWLFCAVLC